MKLFYLLLGSAWLWGSVYLTVTFFSFRLGPDFVHDVPSYLVFAIYSLLASALCGGGLYFINLGLTYRKQPGSK